MIKIKYVSIILSCLSILLNSCNENPAGYVNLKDVDDPAVEIISPVNNTVINDTLGNIIFEVKAFDIFGLNNVTLFVNGNSIKQSGNGLLYLFNVPQNYLDDDSNYVYATAMDNSNRSASTKTNLYSFKRSIIVANPIENLVLVDTTQEYSIDLAQIFRDTFEGQADLNYRLLSNSNESILDATISNDFLILHPKRYIKGSTTLTVKAFSGPRFLLYNIDIHVQLSKPMKKIYIPDNLFRNTLIHDYNFTDFEEDSVILEEAANLQSLDLSFSNSFNIKTLAGIEYFNSLKELDVSCHLSELDISSNYYLEKINLGSTLLKQLDLSNLTNLKELNIEHNTGPLNLVFQNNIKLEVISLYFSFVSSLDISSVKSLKKLYIDKSLDQNIDLSKNSNLEKLDIIESNLVILDLSNNDLLKYINLRNNALLTKTYLWELPLPTDVEIYKDDHNELLLF